MEAGRELDALVAQTVMSWTIYGYAAYDNWLARSNRGDVDIVFIDRDGVVWRAVADLCNVWSPSTDIADAWQVVEKLAELGMLISVCWGRSGNHGIIASVDILEAGFDKPIAAHTAPLAICLAALETVKQH